MIEQELRMKLRVYHRVIIAALALAGLLALARSLLIVDQTESVFVTEFGRPVRLIELPGLYFKWPHQSARAFDRRLQLDTPPAREMLTRDKKNLEIAWYVSWRIADVERFLRTVRTIPDARARLEDMAASVLAAELGVHDLAGLVNVGDQSLLDTMMSDLTRRVGDQAAREYGVEVATVRLRRLNYPEEVRSAVFEQIRSERQRVAAATRAEGESQARVIRSAADRERAAVIASAEADAARTIEGDRAVGLASSSPPPARTIGQGEAQAARIANEAHAADPAFFQFLKSLETYRAALDSKTTLVLSADSSFLKLLTHGVLDPAAPKPSNSPPNSSEPLATATPAERSNTSFQSQKSNAVHRPQMPGPASIKEERKP
jgi:modulator of FtsH protease HflC